MYIYKLKYTDKETAIADLIAKGVIDTDLNYLQSTHAVVWIDKIVIEDSQYDEEGNIIEEPVFAEGYHVDIMVEREIDFGDIAVEPTNPKHMFA
jgi:hypothetical protein